MVCIDLHATVNCEVLASSAWEHALLLLKVCPWKVEFNMMLSASEKAHRHLSVQLWKDMLDTSLQPDEISHNAVISAVEKCALWQSALNLLNSMYQVQPTVISYAATARALARVQRWKEVLHLLNEVAKNWIEADSFVFNAAISACECHWHLALHFLREMWLQQIQTSEISFVAALTSCQRAQRWQEALNCLGVMAGHGVACFATDVHFLEFGDSDCWQQSGLARPAAPEDKQTRS
ncbi:unnamed protein product [Durusdinium trenchii]|uniref:Pentatricopeptide repeat-containing protein, chloroplastic n=1 Tax=Durusdinium trenchii TaxID=1381693 RepID=A0ABP0NHJ4_9DINO